MDKDKKKLWKKQQKKQGEHKLLIPQKKKKAKTEQTATPPAPKESAFDKQVKGAKHLPGVIDAYYTPKGTLMWAIQARNLDKIYLIANRLSETSAPTDFVAGQMIDDPFMVRFSTYTA